MPSIHELLDSASGAGIAELHSRYLGRAGIVQSSRIRAELEAWMSDPVRLERYIAAHPDVKGTLSKLAFAGSAGFPELTGAEVLSRDLMVFRPASEPAGWHILSDWSPGLRETWLQSHAVDPVPPRQDALPPPLGWVEGLAGLSARIDLGQARLNRSGELNRRDRPTLRSSFFHLAHLPEDAAELCLDLTLSFLSERDGISARGGRLECRTDLVDTLPDAQRWIGDIRRWWMRLSLPEGDAWWEQVGAKTLSGDDARLVWSWLDGKDVGSAGRNPSWKELPGRLRQAIALGLLEADVEDGAIARIRPGDEDPLPPPAKALTCTSDFLVYLGPGSSPLLRRGLEAMATREQSGRICRYRLGRDTVLAMSASPLLGPVVQEMIDILDPPPAVRRALAEWMQARRTCQFETLRLLRVRDTNRHQELSALPSVAALVRETIPGWGFVVDPALEPELRKVLATLGYDPPSSSETAEEDALAWAPPEAPRGVDAVVHEQWHLAPPVGDENRRSSVASASKYGETLKALPFSDLLRVAEYAILTDADVEAILKSSGSKPVRFRILRLDKRREPVSLEIRASGARESREIPLDAIRKIRILEG